MLEHPDPAVGNLPHLRFKSMANLYRPILLERNCGYFE